MSHDLLKTQLVKLFTQDEFLNEMVRMIQQHVTPKQEEKSISKEVEYHPKSPIVKRSFISFTNASSSPPNVFNFQLLDSEKETMNLRAGLFLGTLTPYLEVVLQQKDEKSMEEFQHSLRICGVQTDTESFVGIDTVRILARKSHALVWWKIIRQDNLFRGHAESMAKLVDKMFS